MTFAIETIRFIIVDFVISIIYFPLWWYTEGLLKVVRMIVREIRGLAKTFNLKILFQFILKPMFGQYDIWGRIISFGVRIVHFTFLTMYTLVYSILLSFVLILWIVLPFFILFNILFHLGLDMGLSDYLWMYG